MNQDKNEEDGEESIVFSTDKKERNEVVDFNHSNPAISPKLQGTHTFMVRSEVFVVDCKYHPLKNVGQGSYGVVCSCEDLDKHKKYAIKKVPKAFDDLVDAKRVLREVKLMRFFNHKNVVGLRDVIPPLDNGPFDDIYCVMDLMETDLHRIIYSKNELGTDHVRYFIYQTLRGLKYIHSANVLHRDIKPSNLLVNGNCELKICDFGLARGVDADDVFGLTEYVVTRWYRAPEVILSCDVYDAKVDVWSVGCIMAELFGRTPLFPGEDQVEQIRLIFNLLGTPTAEELKFVTNPEARKFLSNIEPRHKVSLSKLFPQAPSSAIDLLEKMFRFNPADRITVDDALKHPFFSKLSKLNAGATVCSEHFNFDFEKLDLSKKEVLQSLVWEEIQHFRPYLKNREMPRNPSTR